MVIVEETIVKYIGQLTGGTCEVATKNTGQNRRRNHRKRNVPINRAHIQRAALIRADGVVCTLCATHYLVEGWIGSGKETISTEQLDLDTGEGFKSILGSVLPPDWETLVDIMARPTKFKTANGRLRGLEKRVWLIVRLERTLYSDKFIIDSWVAVEMKLAPEVLNRHL